MVVVLWFLYWDEGDSKEVGPGEESSEGAEHCLAVELLSPACLSSGETCLGVTIGHAGAAGGGGGGGDELRLGGGSGELRVGGGVL